jgi:hypothetical protein
MSALAVPDDVTRVLAARALVPTGALGPARGWVACAPDGTCLELVPLAAVLDDALAGRAARLAGLRHPHVAAMRELVVLGPGRLGLLVEHLSDLTLAALGRARAPLSDEEAVTLAVPLAQALSALHEAGLAHGALTAQDVVLTADGRPVLVGLRAVLLGGGEVGDDVPRLLATVLDAMPGADADLLAWSDDDEPSLRQVLDRLVAGGTATAADVVDACFATTAPAAIRLPDGGALAGALLTWRDERDERPGDPAGVGDPRARSRAGDDPMRAGRRAARAADLRRRRRVLPAVLAALVVVLAGVGGVLWWSGASGASNRFMVDLAAVADRSDPARAAAALTRVRAAALAGGQDEDLAAAEVPGGPAHASDLALLAALGGRADGLTVDVVSSRVVAVDDEGSATVVVTAATSCYGGAPAASGATDGPMDGPTDGSADGAADAATAGVGPPAPARAVLLDLRWTDDGWRVWSVSASPG